VKIYDADLEVFQVQEEAFPRPKNDKANGGKTALIFGIKQNPFSFAVKRRDNDEVLFDTVTVPLVFEKQYVRLRTKLPANPNIYGLGEHSDSFRFHTDDYERVLLNAESPNIPENANLYGTHPIYFDHRGDKGTHGVFMLNSSPMQVDIKKAQDGSQYLEYNTIGGIIDLYFMAGSKPAEVSKQYADIAGYSAMYPYWTFGFHQCKYGYWDVNMVAEVVGNYSTAGIPLEVSTVLYIHVEESLIDNARLCGRILTIWTCVKISLRTLNAFQFPRCVSSLPLSTSVTSATSLFLTLVFTQSATTPPSKGAMILMSF
jgi:alpha-glucosidase